MTSVCLYFKVHQPNRLKSYSGKDININHCYEDHLANKAAVDIASESCYLPANELLIRLLKTNVDVRINFSISGVVLELFEKYRPDLLQ